MVSFFVHFFFQLKKLISKPLGRASKATQFYAFYIEQLEVVLEHASKHRGDGHGQDELARGIKRIGKEEFSYSNVNLSVALSFDTR